MRDSEDHLRLLIDTIPTLAWSARPDGSARFFNQHWLDYTGIPAEQALDWGWKAAIHPDDLPRILDTFREALSCGKGFEVEGRFRRNDGEFRWFLFRGNPLLDQSGRVAHWYGTNTDIEDRKRAEDALRASEQSFRLAIDSIPGFLNVFTATGEIEFANQTVLRFFGKGLEELRGWATSDLIHPEDLPGVIAAWTHTLESGEPFDLVHRLRRADGVYRWVHGRALPTKDANGRITRWYSLVTDIEERKHAKEKLEKALAEIKLLKDQLVRENIALRDEIDRVSMFEEIVGTSQALQAVLSRVIKVAPTDSSVLITGETGTGKELVARAIHKRSPRSQRAFVSVNCAALPPSLIASELFGHEKGAFTGSTQRRLGRFELANGGTIFLDEVGELPQDTQVALLRVLQEREFETVGGKQPIQVDVRVIAATNRDLEAARTNGTFRSDLYFRLNVFPIEVPPLRERKDDIVTLLEYFVHRFGRKLGKAFTKIDKRSIELFCSYDWPGNIRELQNVVERSVIISSGDVFCVDEAWLSRHDGRAPVRILKFERYDNDSNRERQIIEAALAASRGRVYGSQGAAARLRIPPSTLDSKIKKLNIHKSHFKLG